MIATGAAAGALLLAVMFPVSAALDSRGPVSAAPDSATIAPRTALDWSKPWQPPHDSRVAASNPDEYAWRLFVSVNWPADARRRAANPAKRLGDHGPVAWEVWQNAQQVYLEDGGDPGPWVTGQPAPDVSAETRFETISLKEVPNARHIVGGKMVPLTEPAAGARRLTEIRMNRPAFEYIRAHELYNLDGQIRVLTAGRPISFPSTSIEIKAKWRPIRADEESRYHTLKVRFADGSERLYGLTALHIVSKVLPQWLWTTFEHIDNPTLRDAEGWQLPSVDRFACAGESADCNRAPRGIGLEGTVWENYRLRGTLTRFVDDTNRPVLLASSELETGMQKSSSCITCHARSSIGLVDGAPARLPIFDMSAAGAASPAAPGERRGYIGTPQPEWFEHISISGKPLFAQLDFVWSLSKARPHEVTHEN
jgi:hypothetical protein